LLTTVVAASEDPPESKPSAASHAQAARTNRPADKVVIGGQPVAKILAMLGAKREVGVSDEQLLSYADHFDRTDPNHDGQHSREEYVERGGYMTPQARAGIFRAADNNADGVVTRTEYVLNRIITDEAKRIVQQTDADKDGRVTGAEFVEGSPIEDKAISRAVFDALDTSGDGMVTIPEYLRVWGGWARPNYKAQEATLAARLSKLRREDDGSTSGKPDQGGQPAGGPPSIKQMFQVMDRDQDGELSKAEFRGPSHVFTAADKDKNGRVTRAEMEAFRARTGKGSPGGSSLRGPGRSRAKFAKPHALDPAIVKEGHNLVVNSDGNEVPPQGRPIQQGYRLTRVDRFVEEPNQRAYAKVFSIIAPIRDALIHHLDATSPAQWKQFTSILEKNDIKTRQWLKGPTPRDNHYSSRGIFEHLRSTYGGKIPAGTVPGNFYADRDYHAMMKYLEEAELELKCRTFSPDFDFTNPEGANPCPHPGQGLIE
jgi:Ca2+-binding EF-hand superfamily protein